MDTEDLDRLDRWPRFPQQWAANARLVAMLCGAIYGALVIGGLIAANLVYVALASAGLIARDAALFACGLASGLLAAFAAYVNFYAIFADRARPLITGTMIVAIVAGVLSLCAFLTGVGLL